MYPRFTERMVTSFLPNFYRTLKEDRATLLAELPDHQRSRYSRCFGIEDYPQRS